MNMKMNENVEVKVDAELFPHHSDGTLVCQFGLKTWQLYSFALQILKLKLNCQAQGYQLKQSLLPLRL